MEPSFFPASSGTLPDRALRPRLRPHQQRGMTLIEVVVAMSIMTIVSIGILQAMVQSRRLTEGSVRQASITSLVQGYMEQFKSVKFTADTSNEMPVSPPTSFTGTTDPDTWKAYTTDASGKKIPAPMLSAWDSTQKEIDFCLVPGTPPSDYRTATLTTGAARHQENVDIDNPDSKKDDSVLNMWVWVNDLTDASNTNLVQCRSIVIVYEWTVSDGGRVRTYRDSMRAIRSIVPTT